MSDKREKDETSDDQEKYSAESGTPKRKPETSVNLVNLATSTKKTRVDDNAEEETNIVKKPIYSSSTSSSQNVIYGLSSSSSSHTPGPSTVDLSAIDIGPSSSISRPRKKSAEEDEEEARDILSESLRFPLAKTHLKRSNMPTGIFSPGSSETSSPAHHISSPSTLSTPSGSVSVSLSSSPAHPASVEATSQPLSTSIPLSSYQGTTADVSTTENLGPISGILSPIGFSIGSGVSINVTYSPTFTESSIPPTARGEILEQQGAKNTAKSMDDISEALSSTTSEVSSTKYENLVEAPSESSIQLQDDVSITSIPSSSEARYDALGDERTDSSKSSSKSDDEYVNLRRESSAVDLTKASADDEYVSLRQDATADDEYVSLRQEASVDDEYVSLRQDASAEDEYVSLRQTQSNASADDEYVSLRETARSPDSSIVGSSSSTVNPSIIDSARTLSGDVYARLQEEQSWSSEEIINEEGRLTLRLRKDSSGKPKTGRPLKQVTSETPVDRSEANRTPSQSSSPGSSKITTPSSAAQTSSIALGRGDSTDQELSDLPHDDDESDEEK